MFKCTKKFLLASSLSFAVGFTFQIQNVHAIAIGGLGCGCPCRDISEAHITILEGYPHHDAWDLGANAGQNGCEGSSATQCSGQSCRCTFMMSPRTPGTARVFEVERSFSCGVTITGMDNQSIEIIGDVFDRIEQ